MPLYVKTSNATPNDSAVNDRIIALTQRHGDVFREVLGTIAPGISTAGLADIARTAAKKAGVEFSFRAKFSYPDDISICRNHEIMGAPPSEDTVIKDGDLVKVAFGTTDSLTAFCVQNWTVTVGDVPQRTSKLMASTKSCLDRVIALCVPGARISSIAKALRDIGRSEGIVISKAFTGHMIGAEPILPPQLYFPTGLIGKDFVLVEGCMLSVFALGHAASPRERSAGDDRTVYDRNRNLSAAFSHMVLIRERGPEVISPAYPAAISAGPDLDEYAVLTAVL